MIGDTDLAIAKAYGMLPAATPGGSDGRTAADNQTVRTVFVIAPDKSVKLQLAYPMTTGRNFDEVLRVIDSLQLTAKHKVATPANWKNGDDVIIAGSFPTKRRRSAFPRAGRRPSPICAWSRNRSKIGTPAGEILPRYAAGIVPPRPIHVWETGRNTPPRFETGRGNCRRWRFRLPRRGRTPCERQTKPVSRNPCATLLLSP